MAIYGKEHQQQGFRENGLFVIVYFASCEYGEARLVTGAAAGQSSLLCACLGCTTCRFDLYLERLLSTPYLAVQGGSILSWFCSYKCD